MSQYKLIKKYWYIIFLIGIISSWIHFKKKTKNSFEPRNVDSKNNIRHVDMKGHSELKLKDVYSTKYEQFDINVPIDLFLNQTNYSSSNSCIQFPILDNLKFNHVYWQCLNLGSHSIVYFYNAYYDNRELVDNSIRIISFAPTKTISSVKYCQIWFPNEKIVKVSKITSAIYMTHESTESWAFHTYLLTCKIPPNFLAKVPAAVSLVESECDVATNVLKVHYNPPKTGKKEDFAICIKALLYPEVDLSSYLIQYIELAKILGVHKIFLYSYDLHPNIRAALRYYEIRDQVHVTPFTMPGTAPNLPVVMDTLLKIPKPEQRTVNFIWASANMERASHTDCFYRNMYKYKYIANFDLDEIMIPGNGETWQEVIKDVIYKKKKELGNLYIPPSGYWIPMGIFLDSFRYNWTPGIPKYMSMLQNVNRTGFLKYYKTLIDTERVLGVSNHRPQRCIGKCIVHDLVESEGFLAHYRGDLDPEGIGPVESPLKMNVTDTRIWHYKQDMIKNVDKALKAIGFLL